MNFAPGYLVGRLFYRIFDFFHHWYVDGSRAYAHWVVNFFEQMEQTFALKVTIQYFFHPLYKDYTIVGRILGIIFRTGRIVVASILYLFFAAAFSALYLLWILIPIFLPLAAGIHFP